MVTLIYKNISCNLVTGAFGICVLIFNLYLWHVDAFYIYLTHYITEGNDFIYYR